MSVEHDLLDWAETLLCNAECPKHCSEEEWRRILHQWMNDKHGIAPKPGHELDRLGRKAGEK